MTRMTVTEVRRWWLRHYETRANRNARYAEESAAAGDDEWADVYRLQAMADRAEAARIANDMGGEA